MFIPIRTGSGIGLVLSNLSQHVSEGTSIPNTMHCDSNERHRVFLNTRSGTRTSYCIGGRKQELERSTRALPRARRWIVRAGGRGRDAVGCKGAEEIARMERRAITCTDTAISSGGTPGAQEGHLMVRSTWVSCFQTERIYRPVMILEITFSSHLNALCSNSNDEKFDVIYVPCQEYTLDNIGYICRYELGKSSKAFRQSPNVDILKYSMFPYPHDNSSIYAISETKADLSWYNALYTCHEMGGDLPSIDSAAEASWIFEHCGGNPIEMLFFLRESARVGVQLEWLGLEFGRTAQRFRTTVDESLPYRDLYCAR